MDSNYGKLEDRGRDVGETTGATTYNDDDMRDLLEWIDRDPAAYHALIDGTSLLCAMP